MMKIKKPKQKKWVSPTENFIKNVDEVVKSGISKEDKQLLLDELDEMVKMLEDWKADNPETTSKKKVA